MIDQPFKYDYAAAAFPNGLRFISLIAAIVTVGAVGFGLIAAATGIVA
jgi:hypothetical protein